MRMVNAYNILYRFFYNFGRGSTLIMQLRHQFMSFNIKSDVFYYQNSKRLLVIVQVFTAAHLKHPDNWAIVYGSVLIFLSKLHL